MAIQISTAAKNRLLNALVKATTAAGGCLPGTTATSVVRLRILTSAQLAPESTSLSSSWTASDTCANMWSTGAVGGVKQLGVTWSGTSAVTGTALSFCVYENSVGSASVTGTVGLSGSGADCILDTLTINTPCKVVSMSWKIPATNGATVRWNEALRNAILNCLFITGTEPKLADGGTLTLYGGTQPTLASDPISGQTALATYTFATTDFNDAASGSIALAATKATTFVAAGTATWGRWTKGLYAMDLSAGTAGSDITLSSALVASGASPTITALTLSV
ncbi:hypothetical protein [Uliginosibacterium gangwonense]|uniref:hypothetical protein n=1 Tax=Uliginosibacterium gangwonense TaxID=392736 RepID=UPI0012FAE943|nr:hypothetical protein [Uliginosibacterium gangwonense]